jgi:hypothetical protein
MNAIDELVKQFYIEPVADMAKVYQACQALATEHGFTMADMPPPDKEFEIVKNLEGLYE